MLAGIEVAAPELVVLTCARRASRAGVQLIFSTSQEVVVLVVAGFGAWPGRTE
jgi:hypothetical protein